MSKSNESRRESPHTKEIPSKKIYSKSRSTRTQFVLDQHHIQAVAVIQSHSYVIGDKIGEGPFSEVFKVQDIKRNQVCAVKIIDITSMKQTYQTKFLPCELKNLADVRHKYVIRIYDIFCMGGRIYIFLEFASRGDLRNYLKSLHRPLTEPHACMWFYQISLALHYMHHEKSVAHSDIKVGPDCCL